MTKARPKLYLVDGPNIAFRAFFAIGEMRNSEGMPTNALYGFTNMILKLIREEKPDYLAIAWDPRGGTFREEEYPAYKGTRPEMPENLAQQMPHFQRLAEAFSIPYLCVPRFEADDVMGTLARAHEADLDVVLVTSDKDHMQLVTEHVSLLDTMKNKRISFDEVREKFGCAPERVPDALGIWGDSSDNIPGVRGIGEKGAKKLLAEYAGLDEIYEHIDEIKPPGVKKKLEASRDEAFLSRHLATIKIDVPLDVTLEQLELVFPPPAEAVSDLFREFDFRTLLKTFGGTVTSVSRDDYRSCLTEKDLAALARELKKAKRFALDTETTSLDALTASLVGLSFCCDEKRAWYVPVAHFYLGVPAQLSWKRVREVLGPILEDPTIGKTGQNLKYDLHVLGQHGVRVQGMDGDTLLADYLLFPERRSHKLDDIALIHLEHTMIPFKDVVGKGETFASVEVEKALLYAAEDAHVTWLLDQKLTAKLEEEGLASLYREIELPLMPVLGRMEELGIWVDVNELDSLSKEFEGRIAKAQAACHEYAGRSFDIGSVKQLREILFEELELPVIRKTKTGPSTDEKVLVELAPQHPLPQAILDYRSLVKLANTYLRPLREMVNPKDGRIHTSYSQTSAATGRLASNDPNLQNIPIRTEEGRRIRHAFKAPEGRIFLSCDYSQVELRVLAHQCDGKGGFAEAFAEGIDVHTQTAAGVFEVPIEEVTKDQRRIAKAVNFGIIYGQGAHGLAQTTRVTRTEAKEYLDRYNERFPEIADFKERTLAFAKEHGYVETLLGRRRPVPGLDSRNFNERGAAERVALNTPIQGSAADLIKKAMLTVDRRLTEDFPGQWMLLQVHDELLFEVDESALDAVREMVVHEMCTAMDLLVPLVVDSGTGHAWDEAR